MNKNKKLWTALCLAPLLGHADNPIVQTYFTPDPAPMVWKDTVYLYAGHDEDVTVSNFFTMNDYRVYSTTDMVNWRDHGSPMGYKSFSWSGGKAWAAQCIPRNGKFYYYATIGKGTGQQPAIAVGVSDRPTGPFKDPLNKPLVSQSWDDIDPTAFIDTDGQAYLFWGNPKLYWVKLNENMTSYTGSINVTNMTTAQFGTRTGNANRATTYEEGPWIFKRKDLYYMVYAAGPLPEPIGYSTSSKPTGPWTYRGEIMSGANTGSFTNHPGIIEYKGKGYFFYHTGKLPGGGGYKRSTAVEELSFNADGTIPKISMTTTGPKPVGNLDPYQRVEGETMAFSSGLKTQGNDQSGVYVSSISNNDYIKLRSVDFRDGAKSFTASVGAGGSGGRIELRLGSQSGTLIGTLTVANTGGATTWKQVTTTINGGTGVNDLFLVFKGGSGDLFNLDWWQFLSKSTAVDPSARPLQAAVPLVDVFTASGAKVRSQVTRAEALVGLQRGVYFVDGQRVPFLGK